MQLPDFKYVLKITPNLTSMNIWMLKSSGIRYCKIRLKHKFYDKYKIISYKYIAVFLNKSLIFQKKMIELKN